MEHYTETTENTSNDTKNILFLIALLFTAWRHNSQYDDALINDDQQLECDQLKDILKDGLNTVLPPTSTITSYTSSSTVTVVPRNNLKEKLHSVTHTSSGREWSVRLDIAKSNTPQDTTEIPSDTEYVYTAHFLWIQLAVLESECDI
jgi:hypothetical protein